MFVQDILDGVEIIYNNWEKKEYKNHLFLN